MGKKIAVPDVIKDPKHKPAFPDDFTTIKGIDPLSPKHIEFDWEILRRNMCEVKEEMTAVDYELLAATIGELLAWIVRGNDLKIIGRRATALAWVVNPQIYGGSSAAKLAKRMGFRKERMAEICADVSREFEVTNRSQAHGKGLKPARN